MGRKATDRGAMLREALGLIFQQESKPLTAQELASHTLLAGLDFTSQQILVILSKAVTFKNTLHFPVRRIPAGRGRERWAFYNPQAHPQLEDGPRQAKPAAPPHPTPPPAESTVVLPTHVRALTLEVGGMRLRIELDALAEAR